LKFDIKKIISVSYDNELNGSRIGNHSWGIDWYYDDLWPWLTLNRPKSRSHDFQFKYFENRERYDDGHKGGRHKGGQVGRQEWAFDRLYEFW